MKTVSLTGLPTGPVRVGADRAVIDREDAFRTPLDRPQADVRRDRVEPGPKRAAPLEASEAAPRAQQRFLERILGVVYRPERPVAVCEQRSSMGLDQLSKDCLVAVARGGQELLV